MVIFISSQSTMHLSYLKVIVLLSQAEITTDSHLCGIQAYNPRLARNGRRFKFGQEFPHCKYAMFAMCF